MTTTATCAGCGAPLPAKRPGVYCAGCLLRGALTPLPAAAPEEVAPDAFGPRAPLRVGDYELLEPIACGGMGSVWRARQVSANRLVAYKTLASGLLASSAERRRFQTEIETAAQLDHPNIVSIYEVGDDDGRPCFTMRLMEGGTLRQPERRWRHAGQLRLPHRFGVECHERRAAPTLPRQRCLPSHRPRAGRPAGGNLLPDATDRRIMGPAGGAAVGAVHRPRGHHLAAPALAFSPDGTQLASAGDDGSVLFWNLEAFAAPPPSAITNSAPLLVFSAHGRWLASGLRGGGLGLWSLPERRLVRAWPQLDFADLIRDCSDAGFLLLGRDSVGQSNLVALALSADADTPHQFGKLDVPVAEVTAAALTPDGRPCCTGGTNGLPRCWGGADGQTHGATAGPNFPIENIHIAPDGRRLITFNYVPLVVRSWSAVPCRWLATNRFPGRRYLAFAFAPDGAECATGNMNDSFQLWDVDTLDRRWTSPPTRSAVSLMAYSPDGQTLATSSLRTPDPWKPAEPPGEGTGPTESRPPCRPGPLTRRPGITLLPRPPLRQAQGTGVLSLDGKLRLWHLPTRRPLLTLLDRPTTQPRLNSLVFRPDGRWLAATEGSGELRLWPAPRQ